MTHDDNGDGVLQRGVRLNFLRRSGEQPQLSTTLLAQTSPVGSIQSLLIWMADNLDNDLSVAKLARRVAMSQRNFSRQFLCQVGKTPGKHVVDLRLEAAQRNLTNTSLSLTDIARISGFTSAEVLRRLFGKKFGTSPGRHRISNAGARVVHHLAHYKNIP